MRFSTFLFVVFFGSRLAATAQNILFGFTGGAGISGIAKTHNVGVAFEQRSVAADFFAGIAADIKIGNDFAFRPQLYFEKKGWSGSYNNLTINLRPVQPYFAIGDSILNSDRAQMNYIKLPLDLSFSLPQVIDGKVSIDAGPYIAYAISGSYSSFYGNNTGTSVYNFKANVGSNDSKTGIHFNRFDYGFHLRMGYELNFGLMIHASYEWGLQNVIQNDLIAGSSATKFRSFLLGFSYMLNNK